MALFGFLRRKEGPLRQQLLEAKAKVERELSIMEAGPTAGDQMGWQPDSITDLRRILADINQQIAELGPGDA